MRRFTRILDIFDACVDQAHRTAALAHSNGTVDFLGSVKAEDAYIEVLRRLQQGSSVHMRLVNSDIQIS